MAGRRTNLALLALLPGAAATGTLAFALGTGWARWAVAAHGAVGLGLVILAPWKSAIARRGMRRGAGHSWASLVLTVLVAVALATGIGHATGALMALGPVTAMQVHVAAALLALPFGAWHVLARRVRPRRTDLSRRILLRSAALAAGSAAAYGGLAGLVRLSRLPGRGARFTGSYDRGSFRPSEMPVTQWLFDPVPEIDQVAWRLRVRSAGREVAALSWDELDRMREPVEAVLDCTGGWFSAQRWEGVRLDRLVPPSGPFRSLEVLSATGYRRRYPGADAAVLHVVTRVGGLPLTSGHGYPARIVAPGRRGFWWVKWVESIELSETPWWWQPPFPLQ
jgi:DMSO/TMAO reductase YedYZ molybdopterin-dependent catalytic subunit